MRTPHENRRGLSLIEVLTALFVIGLLVALLMPAVQRVREASSQTRCANNLRQLALASHACHDATGKLPPYATGQPGTPIFGSWFVHLLPYVGEGAFYDEIYRASTSPTGGGGSVGVIVVNEPYYRDRLFALLTCRSDPTLGTGFHVGGGTSNYLANWFVFGDGTGGCYTPPQKLVSIRNGLSNAILFAEGYSVCNQVSRPALTCCSTHNFGITWHNKPSDDPSYLPNDYTMFQLMPGPGPTCETLRSQTHHTRMPVAFTDASVRFVDGSISPAAWKALMKPRD